MRKKKAKMPPVYGEVEDGMVSDGDDDPHTVHDEEIALGLQQENESEEEAIDWNENDDEPNEEAQNEASSSSSDDSTTTYVARQRQRAEREILENWACSSIEDAFPPKTWLKGQMDVEKKNFDLKNLDTAILLRFQQLSRLTVGASDDVKEKIRKKWYTRNHDKDKRVGDTPVIKQQNLLEDLEDLCDEAEEEQAELKRKAEEDEDRALISDDDEEDESDASSESSIPAAGLTIQTLRDRYSALEQVYENWGIQTLVGRFTDGLHREDVTDDADLDAGVIERLRDLSEITNTARHGRRIRERLCESLDGLREYDVERVVARIALVGHYYVNVRAEKAERRVRGETVSDSSDSEEEKSREADKRKRKGKGKGKVPATRSKANESPKPKVKRRPAQQKAQKKNPVARNRPDDLGVPSESGQRRSGRLAKLPRAHYGPPSSPGKQTNAAVAADNRGKGGRKDRPSLVVKLKVRSLRSTTQRNSQSSVASTASPDRPTPAEAHDQHVANASDTDSAASYRRALAEVRTTLRQAQAMEELALAHLVSARTQHERAVNSRANARAHTARVREELRLIEEAMGGEESQGEDAEDAEPRQEEREDEGQGDEQ
ncbi:hypothetical protein J4E90_010936 [Alternaria incomplexa]|uniref:uncharacterized protein n=1 Tax=Alternaria incomplexa TaxID=1187928 RepID=UPI00221FBEBF|nr:uncharacterized protein J4E90_010936 [Alternaria incomplexa]KAI4906088.1 hypothetical protein J4E90_010936 [Alternaria incomplexa]